MLIKPCESTKEQNFNQVSELNFKFFCMYNINISACYCATKLKSNMSVFLSSLMKLQHLSKRIKSVGCIINFSFPVKVPVKSFIKM